MNPKRSFELLWIGFVLGFILGFWSIPIGSLVIGAAVIQNLIFFRCPHCKTHLGRGLPDYCRKCGQELFWN